MLPFLLATIVVTAIAAWYDWQTGEMPDWLTLGPLLVAPVAHIAYAMAVLHMPKEAAFLEGGFSLGGALLCGLVPWLLYQKDAIGGGDVKLFAAIGALCQTVIGIEAELYSFVAAALIAPARLAYDGKLFQTLGNTLRLAINPFLPKNRRVTLSQEAMTWFRLGPSILIGVLITALLHWPRP